MPPRINGLRLLALVCALVWGLFASAQVSKVRATIEGTVVDTSGASISGAQVTLRDVETNQSRTLATDGQGFFRATELSSGTYHVRVERQGFSVYEHVGVRLLLGHTVELTIPLAPAAVTERVTVTDQPSPIETSQTTVTTTVENERIEELPVRSRNYLDFVLLAPGVSRSNSQQTPTSQTQLPNSGFVFGGLRPRSNNLSIDGLDNDDEYSGSSRTELSLESIREFQVVNNGLSAESGGAAGGSINVITKTGTNAVHGDLFIFAQNGALNARSPLERTNQKPDLSRYRGGVSLGGPLVKNRTFFYLAAEQEHNRGEAASDIEPSVADAINPFLGSGAFPGMSTRQVTTGLFPVVRAETEASAKVNHAINADQSLMLRYTFTNSRRVNDAFNTSGLNDASSRGSSFTKDNALVGSYVSLFGEHRVNDLRFQIASRRVVLRTADELGPEVDIVGLLSLGRSYEGNGSRQENHHELNDTFTYERGSHLIKVGATANHVHLSSAIEDGFGGTYIFMTLPDFLAGNADYFRQAFGNPNTRLAVTSYGGFVQEHWTATKHLTLDFGLRYDFEQLPEIFNQDTNNFSPRVGLAYSPSTNWVLRAGFGIFYDRYILAFLNRATQKNGANAFEQVAEGPDAASVFQQSGGGSLILPLAKIRQSVFRPDPNLPNPYSQQASLSIERLLTKNLTASATYLFTRGVKLPRTANINLLPPVLLTPANAASLGIPSPSPQQLGREVFSPARIDPALDDIYQLRNSASSTYHGFSLSLNKRLSHEFAISANYTVSKDIDDASDFDEQPQNPYDLKSERALSRNHQGQRFVLSALWDLPIGEQKKGNSAETREAKLLTETLGNVSLAPIITVNSGGPVDAFTGLDSARNHSFPLSSRPLGFGRNALTTPAFATVDLRIVKFLRFRENRRLNFVVEFFNLFNRENVTQISPFYGSELAPASSFARPLDAANPRQVQFSMDCEF